MKSTINLQLTISSETRGDAALVARTLEVLNEALREYELVYQDRGDDQAEFASALRDSVREMSIVAPSPVHQPLLNGVLYRMLLDVTDDDDATMCQLGTAVGTVTHGETIGVALKLLKRVVDAEVGNGDDHVIKLRELTKGLWGDDGASAESG